MTLNFSQNEKKGRFFNFLVSGWSKSLKTLKNAKLREDSKNIIENWNYVRETLQKRKKRVFFYPHFLEKKFDHVPFLGEITKKIGLGGDPFSSLSKSYRAKKFYGVCKVDPDNFHVKSPMFLPKKYTTNQVNSSIRYDFQTLFRFKGSKYGKSKKRELLLGSIWKSSRSPILDMWPHFLDSIS